MYVIRTRAGRKADTTVPGPGVAQSGQVGHRPGKSEVGSSNLLAQTKRVSLGVLAVPEGTAQISETTFDIFNIQVSGKTRSETGVLSRQALLSLHGHMTNAVQ